jgi:glycosyltransferase involved in cell wall biosynthesis
MAVDNAGVVVIGRNEGERLRRCLESIAGSARSAVYVDSGSTDGSVELATSMSVAVVNLDMSIPFTAARARNAGFEALRRSTPDITYVQFVDGDCELAKGWIETAAGFLDAHSDVAMVCGRLRERHPERSIYNLLCDFEWDTTAGESRACGGNAMARVQPLESSGGYRADMIAGEEPELCVRLRSQGWKVWRLDAEMALHDAAMTRFGQWWRRSVRNGYAFAEGAYLHGKTAERHGIVESRRIWIWGAAIPLLILAAAALSAGWGLMLLAIYPLQVIRLTLRGKRSPIENGIWALFNVLGKFPGLIGQARFHANRLAARDSRLIEYK